MLTSSSILIIASLVFTLISSFRHSIRLAVPVKAQVIGIQFKRQPFPGLFSFRLNLSSQPAAPSQDLLTTEISKLKDLCLEASNKIFQLERVIEAIEYLLTSEGIGILSSLDLTLQPLVDKYRIMYDNLEGSSRKTALQQKISALQQEKTALQQEKTALQQQISALQQKEAVLGTSEFEEACKKFDLFVSQRLSGADGKLLQIFPLETVFY